MDVQIGSQQIWRCEAADNVDGVAARLEAGVVELVAAHLGAFRAERSGHPEGGMAISESEPVGHASVGWNGAAQRVSVERPRQPQETTTLGPRREAGTHLGPHVV